MKKEYLKIDPIAFGISSAIIAFLASAWIVLAYGGMMGNWMTMPVGIISPHPWLSIWMAVCIGITGFVLAWLYNALVNRPR